MRRWVRKYPIGAHDKLGQLYYSGLEEHAPSYTIYYKAGKSHNDILYFDARKMEFGPEELARAKKRELREKQIAMNSVKVQPRNSSTNLDLLAPRPSPCALPERPDNLRRRAWQAREIERKNLMKELATNSRNEEDDFQRKLRSEQLERQHKEMELAVAKKDQENAMRFAQNKLFEKLRMESED